MPMTKQEELEMKAAAYDVINDLCAQRGDPTDKCLWIIDTVIETNARLEEGRNEGT
jgi:hypothetical protein